MIKLFLQPACGLCLCLSFDTVSPEVCNSLFFCLRSCQAWDDAIHLKLVIWPPIINSEGLSRRKRIKWMPSTTQKIVFNIDLLKAVCKFAANHEGVEASAYFLKVAWILIWPFQLGSSSCMLDLYQLSVRHDSSHCRMTIIKLVYIMDSLAWCLNSALNLYFIMQHLYKGLSRLRSSLFMPFSSIPHLQCN